jgi:UDP-3-O-acyl-N-acetylglucosamine deacetylase
MSKKPKAKAQAKKQSTVTMNVPTSMVNDVNEMLREWKVEQERKTKPLNRAKLFTKDEQVQLLNAKGYAQQLKKPMRVVHRVFDRLEELSNDGDLSRDDEKWIEAQLDEIGDLKEFIENLAFAI